VKTGVVVVLSCLASTVAPAQRLEAIWYLRGERSIQAFIKHADQITIVSPQNHQMDSTGIITGQIDPRVIRTAREKGVKIHPLVMNPGFDQPSIHRVLTNPDARSRALRSLAAFCRDNKFDGIQFDFENFHVRGLPAVGGGRAPLHGDAGHEQL
jgi:spore germination protein YaaH